MVRHFEREWYDSQFDTSTHGCLSVMKEWTVWLWAWRGSLLMAYESRVWFRQGKVDISVVVTTPTAICHSFRTAPRTFDHTGSGVW